jgi:hypothetical protein
LESHFLLPQAETSGWGKMDRVEWPIGAVSVGAYTTQEQTWCEDDKVFTLVRCGDKTYAAASREAKLLGARHCTNPECNTEAVLPGTFLYCPDCGRETQLCERGGPLWHWPAGEATGWPEYPNLSISGLKDRRTFDIDGGKWGLLVAGDPAVLMAYDHQHGRILRYDGAKTWEKIADGSPSGLAAWQRALIASPQGFFYATDERGMGFVSVPFVKGTALAVSEATLGPSKPVGGPGLFKDANVYMPTFADGTLRLEGCPQNVSPVRNPAVWFKVAIQNGADAKQAKFGAPYVNVAGDIFWSSAAGWIALSRNDIDGIRARYYPWRSDFRALPAARPFRSRRDGDVWQLGQILSDDGIPGYYAYHLVSFGNASQQVVQINSPHLSFGQGTFNGDKRYEDPRQGAVIDYNPTNDNGLYIPLSVFGDGEATRYLVAVVDDRKQFKDLLQESGLHAVQKAQLLLLGRLQSSMVDLQNGVDVESAYHLSTTVYDGRLFLYAKETGENHIYSWSIAP